MRKIVMLLALIAICAVALVGYLAMHPRTQTAMVTTHQYQRIIPNTTEAAEQINENAAVGTDSGSAVTAEASSNPSSSATADATAPTAQTDGTAFEPTYPSTTASSLKSDTHEIGPAIPVQVDTIDAAAPGKLSSGDFAKTSIIAANNEPVKKATETQSSTEQKTAAETQTKTTTAEQDAAKAKALERLNNVNKNTFLPHKPPVKAQPTPTTEVASHSSFDKNGIYTLGKEMQKNGFHQGEPTVVVVDKGSHFTYVLQKQAGDRVVIVDRLSNAIGKDKTPSPPGPYKISRIQKMPVWIPTKSIDPKQKPVQPYNKDRKNPLGVACITLNKFDVALHGTNDPNSIRKDQSHGCIRHSNADIIKIVNKVKRNTEVVITNQFVGTKISKAMFGKVASAKHSGTHSSKKHATKSPRGTVRVHGIRHSISHRHARVIRRASHR